MSEDIINHLRDTVPGFDLLPEYVRNALIDSEKKAREFQLNSLESERKALELEQKAEEASKLAKELKHKLAVVKGKTRKGRKVYPKGYKKLPPAIKSENTVFIRSSKDFETHKEISGLNIQMFTDVTYYSFKNDIKEIINELEEKTDVERPPLYYMRFVGKCEEEGVFSTRLVNLLPNFLDDDYKELLNVFENTIQNMRDRIYGYEQVVLPTNKTYVDFVFIAKSFPTPKCIDKWGVNFKEVIRFTDFDVFTANNKDIDCIQQCADYLGIDDEINSMDDIIEYFNGKVCILTPRDYVRNIRAIKSLRDLKLTHDSPIKFFNIIKLDYKYFLRFNGHIGVMHNFRKNIKNNKTTKFNFLIETNKTKKLTACFDIECYFDPEDNLNSHNIPYICCIALILNDEIIDTQTFKERYCVSEMIEYILDFCLDKEIYEVELIAHNGGGYDFHYLLNSLADPSIIKNILIRNNSFIGFSFTIEKIKFSVKDSYSFLLCSLSNAAKAFLPYNDIRKTTFPHHVLKNVKDTDIIMKEWDNVIQKINYEYLDNKLIVTSDNVIEYKEGYAKSKALIEWSEEYCMNDVIVLSKVWIQFKKTTEDIFNYNIVDDVVTLAGMSFKLFQINLPKNVVLVHPIKQDYFNMRRSLFGGRCVSVNGIHKDVYCLDVKSLYPTAMAFYDQPYGNYNRVKSRIPGELGIYYCKVIINQTPVTNFFPIKIDDKIYYNDFNKDVCYGWYTTVDIDIGLSEGHVIEYISFDEEGNVGYSWSKKGKIFKDYIKDVLYRYKLQYEQEGNKVKRTVIKIIMNSLWGKFAQKWIDSNYEIKDITQADFKNESVYDIWDTEYFLVKGHKEKDFASKPLQNGIFTLSYARLHMKKLWDAAAVYNATCIYSDTDSICISKEEFNLDAAFELDGEVLPVIGDEIGQLELECTFNKLMCAGKKQYMGFYYDIDQSGDIIAKEKKRFKGIPSQYIIPEMFEHLLNQKDKVVEVNFLKFRREWGVVSGYIEKKNVKAT